MDIIGDIFREVLMRPLGNSLVLLYLLLFKNFGLSIIALTVVIRLLTMRLTLKQIKSTRAMSLVQPQLKAMQAHY